MSPDRYEVVPKSQYTSYYNWLQQDDVPALEVELGASGMTVTEVAGDVAGGPFIEGKPEFAVIARAITG